MSHWSFEPGIVAPIALSAILYAVGARRSRGVTVFQRVCFWTGIALLIVALLSPLDSLGEQLFSAHMAQHEILMLAAAPMLVLARPLVPILWAFPLTVRRSIGHGVNFGPMRSAWRGITRPIAAWTIHAAAIWIWHVPVLFDATLRSGAIHAAQHASFLGSALLFWWSAFDAKTRGAAVLSIFTTAVHTSILGALLTFSPVVWYRSYLATAPERGFSALQDQQIGGLIMWVPAGVIYLSAGLICFAAWLRQTDFMESGSEYAS